jgi:hypothetical protein
VAVSTVSAGILHSAYCVFSVLQFGQAKSPALEPKATPKEVPKVPAITEVAATETKTAASSTEARPLVTEKVIVEVDDKGRKLQARA